MESFEIDAKIRELELEISYLKLCKTENNYPKETKESPVFLFKDLVDTNQLQELMDLFFELVGLGIGIIDESNQVLVSTGWQDVCTKFHRIHPESCKRCIESDDYLAKFHNGNIPIAYKCKNGLWDIAIPIIIDGKILASVYFGQFFYDDEKIDFEFFEKQADQFGFEKEVYLSALRKVPIVSHRKVETLIKFYAKLAQLIADSGYQNLLIKRDQINERNIEEKKLKQTTELLTSISDNVPAMIAIFDRNLNYVLCE
ncbi:MAG: PocR ligand-binding domain-containing protein [Bacteroidia bacterium]